MNSRSALDSESQLQPTGWEPKIWPAMQGQHIGTNAIRQDCFFVKRTAQQNEINKAGLAEAIWIHLFQVHMRSGLLSQESH